MLSFAGDPNARSVAYPRGNPHIDCSGLSVVLDREPSRGSVVRILQRELDFVLHVATCALARTPARRLSHLAAEERRKEIGEGVRVAKQLLHLLLRHGAEATGARAAATHVGGPLSRKRIWAALRLGLLVQPPVGAKLVVLLPLGR